MAVSARLMCGMFLYYIQYIGGVVFMQQSCLPEKAVVW